MSLTPTVNTYANLQKPKQFRPSESVKFLCYFSQDIAPSNATLVLYGGVYGYQHYIKPYHPTGVASKDSFSYIYKQEGYANMAIGNIWQIEFEVPAYAIGDEHFNHPEDISWGVSGMLKARIEFGDTVDDEGFVTNPYFISNSVYLPLYHAPLKPLFWGNWDTPNPTVINSSSTKLSVSYYFYGGGVLESNNQINSYRYMLYDENYNLIYDSKNKFDWISSTYVNHWLKFNDLENNKTYHAKVKATLVGGYELTSDYLTFTTSFADRPTTSDKFTLVNNKRGGCVEAKTTLTEAHTKITLSRCIKDSEEYLTIKTFNTDGNYTFKDYMCLPNKTYTYKLDVFNGELLVGTYYSEITHEIEGVCVADIYGAYSTFINVTKYSITKNARELFQETVGSKYPFGVVTTEADYFKSGSLAGEFIEDIDDCTKYQENLTKGNAALCKRMMNWLNNGEAKLLKYDDGFAAIIMKEGEISENANDNDPSHTITFSWREIADKEDIENYTKLGMVGEI